MKKLDNKALADYNNMLETELVPKQSVFSPSKQRLDKTPGNKPYKTPSKVDMENQRGASRKAYISASKDRALATQILSGGKRRNNLPSEAYPESKEVTEQIKVLTNIINEKQKLIVGITKRLGEFIGSFRDVRDILKILKGNSDNIEYVENAER